MLGGLTKLRLKEVGNAPDGSYWQVTTAVRHNIALEEVVEVVDNNVAHPEVAKMLVDERGE